MRSAGRLRAYDLAVTTPRQSPNRVLRATIVNLGCKVNQAEMDAVERLLRASGADLVSGREAADLVVVNTCTVTGVADRKSRQAVRRARRVSPGARVLVTGCSVAVGGAELAAVDPGARLYDNEAKGRLHAEVAALLDLPADGPLPTLSGVERGARSGGDFETDADETAEGDAFARDIDRTRAFVKIQDGCSFHCTYCIIPRARGEPRPVTAQEVLAGVRGAIAGGHREVVLTGINAGMYDDAGVALPGLVRRILAETPIERIRLSSIEPQHVSGELLEVWAGSGGRCLPHFHVPLQSGDDSILRRMGRRYDAAAYAAVVERILGAVPGAAIHADVIAGFPAEDDAAWQRTLDLARTLELAGLHVFRYSARPGTPAARMAGQTDARTRKRRAAEGLTLAAELRARFALAQIGREMRVLFERQLPDGRWLGHAENYVAVAAGAAAGSALDNEIALIRGRAIDPERADRVLGDSPLASVARK